MHAARGGRDNKYAGNDDIYIVAWFGDNSGGTSHKVKTRGPNGYGLYDMSGNVGEWCWDVLEGDYDTTQDTNPTGIDNPNSLKLMRIILGGNWNSEAKYCEVSRRYNAAASLRSTGGGFRVVCRYYE